MTDKGFWVAIFFLLTLIFICVCSSRMLTYTGKIHETIQKNSEIVDTIKKSE